MNVASSKLAFIEFASEVLPLDLEDARTGGLPVLAHKTQRPAAQATLHALRRARTARGDDFPRMSSWEHSDAFARRRTQVSIIATFFRCHREFSQNVCPDANFSATDCLAERELAKWKSVLYISYSSRVARTGREDDNKTYEELRIHERGD